MTEELAKKYAYNIITCPGSTEDIDAVLESWQNNKHHQKAHIWYRFEDCDPSDLLREYDRFKENFITFAQEITNQRTDK